MRDIEGSLKKFSLLTILCNVCVTWTVAARPLCPTHSYNDHAYKYSVKHALDLHIETGNTMYVCVYHICNAVCVCVVSTRMLSVSPAYVLTMIFLAVGVLQT